ncbi:SWIM zinc finger family protein [Rhodococcus sp. BP-252]|uniref:SWIM zinc finger family protein n=1 Tax=unclassified Rhodococcus (in: high G+C Gram-positive bacteria) TaxID=192944 RepID=UPI001C9A5E8D|nr:MULTISPECIES: SWIM zinc finger family protein [unclassified Rhodococcus (in: high G+C Gram-positive bacteria)]MBY6413985.1 SWIM zinc finger family protein [Rhodococcus sp. BP-320]MBY6418782.1 SWIM zinc finger family protein [Rhodococcus sp. BP-321]MBY6423337.1 SWIM zinc finger family protein [Rhodococcus sp. BP-324]MBY6428817.1 SWIM zinc finger family protein [Rhodococcus sp. BP-323]MBY6433823.1 SWIM zinc finger family protein [Rhodococcus sp. BP-322]
MADFSQYGKRRQAKGGIEARNKRGAFGQTWWGRHFVTAMEELADPGRIARGRTYARGGQVLNLGVERGQIYGEVQGSQLEPFSASVMVDPLSSGQIDALVDRVSSNPGMLAELASNAIPQALASTLLPHDKGQLDFDCTCPDDGWPCKHAAALMYIAAEHIDASATTILTLRGVDLDQLIEGVGEAEVEVGTDDWFGDEMEFPALPKPDFAPAVDDLDMMVLRRALRSTGSEEHEVTRGVEDLKAFYRRL